MANGFQTYHYRSPKFYEQQGYTLMEDGRYMAPDGESFIGAEEMEQPVLDADPLIDGVQYRSIQIGGPEPEYANQDEGYNNPNLPRVRNADNDLAYLKSFGIEPINHPEYGWIARDDANYARAFPDRASSSIFDYGPFVLGALMIAAPAMGLIGGAGGATGLSAEMLSAYEGLGYTEAEIGSLLDGTYFGAEQTAAVSAEQMQGVAQVLESASLPMPPPPPTIAAPVASLPMPPAAFVEAAPVAQATSASLSAAEFAAVDAVQLAGQGIGQSQIEGMLVAQHGLDGMLAADIAGQAAQGIGAGQIASTVMAPGGTGGIAAPVEGALNISVAGGTGAANPLGSMPQIPSLPRPPSATSALITAEESAATMAADDAAAGTTAQASAEASGINLTPSVAQTLVDSGVPFEVVSTLSSLTPSSVTRTLAQFLTPSKIAATLGMLGLAGSRPSASVLARPPAAQSTIAAVGAPVGAAAVPGTIRSAAVPNALAAGSSPATTMSAAVPNALGTAAVPAPVGGGDPATTSTPANLTAMQDTYRPVQDAFAADALAAGSPAEQEQRAAQAGSTVTKNYAKSRAAFLRAQAGLGTKADSGNTQSMDLQSRISEAGDVAAAENKARQDERVYGTSVRQAGSANANSIAANANAATRNANDFTLGSVSNANTAARNANDFTLGAANVSNNATRNANDFTLGRANVENTAARNANDFTLGSANISNNAASIANNFTLGTASNANTAYANEIRAADTNSLIDSRNIANRRQRNSDIGTLLGTPLAQSAITTAAGALDNLFAGSADRPWSDQTTTDAEREWDISQGGGVSDGTWFRRGGLVRPPNYRKGGLARGPGTPTSDSIPVTIDGRSKGAISTGEYVINAKAAKKIGYDKLDKMNLQGLPPGSRMKNGRHVAPVYFSAPRRAA